MRLTRRGRRRGFTLPEIMMAMIVLALAVGAFAVTFPTASQAISRARHIDQASDSCQRQLDYYRDIGYSSLPAIASGASNTSLTFTPSSDLPAATGTVTFTRVDENFSTSTSDTGRVKIEATVTWTGVRSDKGTYTLTSLVVQ